MINMKIEITALNNRIDRLTKALTTALVWAAQNNPPIYTTNELRRIGEIIKGE